MSSSVEELVKGLGEATGLEQTNAKALTSKLLETMEPPLKTVGAGEVLSEVVGLKQLHAEVKRAEAEVEAKAKAEAEVEAAQPPTPEVPAKKPMSKKDKERAERDARQKEKEAKKEKERQDKSKGKESTAAAAAAEAAAEPPEPSGLMQQAKALLPAPMASAVCSMLGGGMATMLPTDKQGVTALLLKLGVRDDGDAARKTDAAVGVLSSFLQRLPAVAAVYPMLATAVPWLTPSAQEGEAATTSEGLVDTVTSSFGAALAPLTEGVGKAVGAAHTAAGGDGAATEQAVATKSKGAMKYLKDRFKRMFASSSTKEAKQKGPPVSPGPDEAPDPTATPTPTPTPDAASACVSSAGG